MNISGIGNPNRFSVLENQSIVPPCAFYYVLCHLVKCQLPWTIRQERVIDGYAKSDNLTNFGGNITSY
jgi:hypothetical protein